MFHAYESCSKVWEQAKLLYTNDTQCLHGVCQDLLNIVAPRRLDSKMVMLLFTISKSNYIMPLLLKN